jgi:hypothetical protein
VIINGEGAILDEGEEFDSALALLRQKYQQYHSMKLENRPIIKITPSKIIAWKSDSAVSGTVKPNA